VELTELYNDWDDLTTLLAQGHVDKAAFRDACTEWLVDCMLWENGAPALMSGGTECDLAAPEPDHIQYTTGIEVPSCVADTGRRCEPDCACEQVWMIPDDRPGAIQLTVWELSEAEYRHWRARRHEGEHLMDSERLIDALARVHDCPWDLDLVDEAEFGCDLGKGGPCRVARACYALYPDDRPAYEQHARTLMKECWRKWFGEEDA
jgi:hypothetical protein